LRVPEAVVFDSNAWFYLRGGEAVLSLCFPGGYFYHFKVIGPMHVARLTARFIITSTYQPTHQRSPSHQIENQTLPQTTFLNRSNARRISMQPLSFGSPKKSREMGLAASNHAAHMVTSPEYPRRRSPKVQLLSRSFDGGASLTLPALGGGGGGVASGGSGLSVSFDNSCTKTATLRRELPPVKAASSVVLTLPAKITSGLSVSFDNSNTKTATLRRELPPVKAASSVVLTLPAKITSPMKMKKKKTSLVRFDASPEVRRKNEELEKESGAGLGLEIDGIGSPARCALVDVQNSAPVVATSEPIATSAGKLDSKIAMDVFRAIDTDGDGEIDKEEFVTALQRFGIELSTETNDFDLIMTNIDLNSNGNIDEKEFNDWFLRKSDFAKRLESCYQNTNFFVYAGHRNQHSYDHLVYGTNSPEQQN